MIRSTIRAAVTAACLIGMTSLASLAASAFDGVWKVKDTAGRPFEITLSSGGVAKATRGEGMTGTWKEEGNAAVITWKTGWTTRSRMRAVNIKRQRIAGPGDRRSTSQ